MDPATALLLGTALLAAWFAWLTPNHYPPWLTYHSELSMAVSAACLVAWTLWRGGRRFTQLPAVAAVPLVAAALPFLQLALGVISFAGDAWLPAMYLVGFALTAWAGYVCVDRYGILRSLKPLQAVILAGALASMWLAFYQWLALDYLDFLAIDITPGMRPYANVIQPNQLATLLLLGIVATAYLFEDATIGWVGAASSTLFLAFGVAMTQSRSGLLALAVMAAVLLWRRRVTPRGSSGTTQIAIVAALALAMPLAWAALRDTGSRAATIAITHTASAEKRLIHWSTLADAAVRKPWLGYGWNQVGQAQYAVAPDHAASGETIGHAHNLVLDLLVENGLVVGTIFVAALAAWLALALKRTRDMPTLLALCAVIATLVHAMLEFPLHYTYFLLPIAFLMGAVSRQTATGFVWRVPIWIAPTLLIVVVGLVAVTSREYFQLETAVRDMRFAQAHVGPARPFQRKDYLILTQLSHFWNFAYSEERRDMKPEELEEMRRVAIRFTSRQNLVRYAVLLAINGQGAAAPEVLRRVCLTNPEDACEQFQEFWKRRGEIDPEVAAIPWPVPPRPAGQGSAISP